VAEYSPPTLHPTIDELTMRIHHDKHHGSYFTALDAAREPTDGADEYLHSWVCWREACEDVRSAYEGWKTCESSRRGIAFASYRAALDREDQAAYVYSVWAARLQSST
jgi:hypothetical protein